jgi:hypothetical protein
MTVGDQRQGSDNRGSSHRGDLATEAASREERMSDERGHEPEDITRLVVERVNAGDAVGVAALYRAGR